MGKLVVRRLVGPPIVELRPIDRSESRADREIAAIFIRHLSRFSRRFSSFYFPNLMPASASARPASRLDDRESGSTIDRPGAEGRVTGRSAIDRENRRRYCR